ncbi:HEAT repeat domain-containing protein [Tumidithrix elongata RA019]|uniref:HEAT repeat domain-containing protein n=1 Tax=Tumidithrix elongata BACA0141 TaxID=2716417 RepID=A0AAW9PU75_9CYAN|nr:HEAT repeat domain-containing protein [Tumidithrix elongata RA019]
MTEEDLALLDIETSINPLDQPAEEELPRPDPEVMLSYLNSDSVFERIQAARAFCEIEDERAVPKLIELLQDDCLLVRVSAAYAIGRNKSEAAIPYLLDRLNKDWNGYVRKGVVWALGTCRDPRALTPLISALKYDISAVRLWAASALGQLGDIKAVEPLTEALQSDKMSAVRGNCAWSLGKLLIKMRLEQEDHSEIYQDAVDALIDALSDDDLGVGADARGSLRKLGDPRGLKVLDKIDIEQGYCEF